MQIKCIPQINSNRVRWSIKSNMEYFNCWSQTREQRSKKRPNSADAGVAGDLHTLRIDHLFFLQSNESNFFSSDCEKASLFLRLGFCSLDAHEWMEELWSYSSLLSSQRRTPGPCCYRLLFLRWLWAMRAARENNKSANAAAAAIRSTIGKTGTFFSPQYFAGALDVELEK